MSVEFRQRRISEYARIALKRKWLILLPTIAIGLAIGYVVFRLPDIYESSTLIVVKPSTLPNSVVPTMTEENLTRELTSISQVVTSRSSLQPLLEKYDLYHDERLRGEPMEMLIDAMRKKSKSRSTPAVTKSPTDSTSLIAAAIRNPPRPSPANSPAGTSTSKPKAPSTPAPQPSSSSKNRCARQRKNSTLSTTSGLPICSRT